MRRCVDSHSDEELVFEIFSILYIYFHAADMFLIELGKEKPLTMENLIICCLDLFVAGQHRSFKGIGARVRK
jgi:hypothetical protein